jgi:hypothetical protein
MPTHYAAMVANGRSRGAAFSVEAVKAQWMRFLLFRVMPEAAAWHGRRHGVEARFAQLRCIARQKNSNPSDSSVASSSNCSESWAGDRGGMSLVR